MTIEGRINNRLSGEVSYAAFLDQLQIMEYFLCQLDVLEAVGILFQI
jgi:hypothetical protein